VSVSWFSLLSYRPVMPTARVPSLAPELPRSGGAASRGFGRALLALLGWRIRGNVPNHRKLVLIVAPHSSNWDFIVGVAAKLALGLRVLFLGKETLFRFPLGPLMRALGGMPVDRAHSQDIVRRVAGEFAAHERLVLALAPEGTRQRVDRWRTGFYHIAREAGVPIVTVALNWGDHSVDIGELFQPTGDPERDIAELRGRFAGVRGRNEKG
jgi:1-acyl-sn-glycerol-3-phosphate acyltransferase